MFKSTLLVLITLFVFQTTNAQFSHWYFNMIQPDYSRSLGHVDFDHETLGRFAHVNSELVRIYKLHHSLELAVYSEKNKKFYRHSKVYSFNDDNSLYGQPFAFEYLGTTFVLAYTRFHTSWLYPSDGNRWLRLFKAKDNTLKNWHQYEISTRASKDQKLKYYTCAYSSGKYVYLLYDTELEYKENNDKFIHYYHEIRIDECTIESNGKPHVHKTYKFKNVVANESAHPVAVEGFKHPDGQLRLIVSYSSEYNPDLVNNGGGVVVLNLHDLSYKHLHTWSVGEMGAVRAFFGTLKGKIKTSEVGHKDKPMRIQIIYNKNYGDDGTSFTLRTYIIDGKDYKLYRHIPIGMHSKMLWNSDGSSSEKVAMGASINFTSLNADDGDDKNDMVEQSIWLFHSNGDDDVYANVFESDVWKANHSKTVSSTDLMNDKKYGKEIRSLWTLVGITDGAPPIAINWNKWDSVHPHDNTFPTTLDFMADKQETTTVSQTYERGFYTQTKVGIHESFSAVSFSQSVSFKYASQQKNTTTSEKIVRVGLELRFDQSNDAQNRAFLIWIIPDIHRLEYAVYPWWDDDCKYPQDSSTVFVFNTPRSSYFVESVPISEPPFNINNANADSMTDWINRDTVNAQAGIHSLNPINLSWGVGLPNPTATFFTEKMTTNSYSDTHSYSVDGSVSVDIPGVFDFNTSVGGNWKFTNSCTTSSSISKEVKVSLENLHSMNDGLKDSSISINAYFFQPRDGVNWWYYKYFGKHRPWYIAYEVINVTPIKVSQPYRNDIVRAIPSFSWTHEDQTDYDYTVLFSTDFTFATNTIEVTSGKQKSIDIPNDLASKFPNDSVIYWVVKGKNSKGKYSWSKTHWFVISKDKDYAQSETGKDKLLLDFVIFPNPIQEKQTNILIKSGLDSEILSLEVFSLDGKIVYKKVIQSNLFVGSKLGLDLSMLSSGFYSVKLESESHVGVGKIVIP